MAGRDCATLQVGGGESRFGEFLGVFCEKRLPLTSGARVVCSRPQAKASLARAQALVVRRGRQGARGSCGDGGHCRSKYTVVGEKIKQKKYHTFLVYQIKTASGTIGTLAIKYEIRPSAVARVEYEIQPIVFDH